MTTAASAVPNVYDLTYPSPTSLKEISSIAVIVQLWREEICVHLESKRLREFNFGRNIQLKTVLPYLPSTIYNSLERYVTKFKESIALWLIYHHRNDVFPSCRSNPMDILSRFHDFAYDWDGSIHNVRTAERMMLSDRLDEEEKFKIACLYCFEEHIHRMWPSVDAMMDLDEIDFHTCPQLYYWICYLRNELHAIPNPRDETIEELMLQECEWGDRNYSFLEYFWDRIPSDRRFETATDKCMIWGKLFHRFILPKLNKRQLEVFLAENGGLLMWSLFFSEPKGPCRLHVLRIWMYIRHEINLCNFICFIEGITIVESKKIVQFKFKEITYLIGEIWKSAPQHLKRSTLEYILHYEPSFLSKPGPWGSAAVKFLFFALHDADFKERNAFWLKNWRNVMKSAWSDDLKRFMTLCLRNENETTLSDEDATTKYQNVTEWCAWSLEHNIFEIENVVSVCYPDERNRREFKRRFLMSNLLGVNSILTMNLFENEDILDYFIGDAFQDTADLGVEFRKQFTSATVTQNRMFECIRVCNFFRLMDFVDTFIPDEKQRAGPQKKRLFEYFKEHAIAGSIPFDDHLSLDCFVFWLLGSDEDEVIKFKKSISVDDIFRAMVRFELEERARDDDDSPNEFPEKIDEFLLWYFNRNDVKVEEFKNRFPDEVNTFVPRKRRRTDSSDSE